MTDRGSILTILGHDLEKAYTMDTIAPNAGLSIKEFRRAL